MTDAETIEERLERIEQRQIRIEEAIRELTAELAEEIQRRRSITARLPRPPQRWAS